MILERVVHDVRETLRKVLHAFDHNITARDNLAPEGTASYVLTSNGPNTPPSYQAPTGGSGTGSVWHNGAGAPAAGLGANGDYYLNTSNGDVYFKSGGAWI